MALAYYLSFKCHNVKLIAQYYTYLKLYVCIHRQELRYAATWEGSRKESGTRNIGMDGKIILKHKQPARKRNLLNQCKIGLESRFKKSVEWTVW